MKSRQKNLRLKISLELVSLIFSTNNRVTKSKIAELGVITTEPIKEGEMIIEYTGEISLFYYLCRCIDHFVYSWKQSSRYEGENISGLIHLYSLIYREFIYRNVAWDAICSRSRMT
jgi:hypothetical protein